MTKYYYILAYDTNLLLPTSAIFPNMLYAPRKPGINRGGYSELIKCIILIRIFEETSFWRNLHGGKDSVCCHVNR